MEFLRDGVGRDRQLTAKRGGSFYAMVLLASAVDDDAWGGSFCAMESVAIGSGRRRVEGRCSRWSPSRLRSVAGDSTWRAGRFLS